MSLVEADYINIGKNKNPAQKMIIWLLDKNNQNCNELEMSRKFFQPFVHYRLAIRIYRLKKYPGKKKAGLNPAQNLLGKN